MRIETNPDIDARAFQYDEPVDRVEFSFAGVSRREFVNVLGAGLLIVVAQPVLGQEQPPTSQPSGGGRRGGGGGRGGREQPPRPVATRVHIGKDGAITVMTGKVECGQGARAELTQAAAEELRVAPEKINLTMADTSLCPDDGVTAGSRSTPSSVPAVRQGAAAARDLLIALAARRWGVEPTSIEVRDGRATNSGGENALTYADLAADEDAAKSFAKIIPPDVKLASVKEWKVMGVSLARPNGYGIVTGKHQYPSDTIRPGMLYGKVLRPESFGAKLASVDTSAAKAMKEVIVIEDGSFVGVAAPTSFAAKNALAIIAKTAKWEASPQPSSAELWDYLRKHARGGVPPNPFAEDLAKSAKQFKQTYHVPYVQHAPMEPRAAVGEWTDGKVTVWTATQNPFGCRGEIARAFNLQPDSVRVIVPDFGGGFGGKHSGESAIEAARLAQAAKRPVSLRWTRQEEFTWAYFRAASVNDIQAGLDEKGTITSWFHLNINHGQQSIETPYKIAQAKSQFVPTEPTPLRHGSYRGLASTPNTFARECAMDELAALAGRDPLEFRLAHLENPRLRAVLELVAEKFKWTNRLQKREPNIGVGLACSIDKGSFVATCAEVVVDPSKDPKVKVRHVCQAFECGAIVNPDNLMAQVKGGIIMGLGPALREAMEFENGRMRNATFWKYNVPRFEDVPELDVHLLNRPDLPSVGAGETPLIAVSAAIANAVANATGTHVREMPVRIA